MDLPNLFTTQSEIEKQSVICILLTDATVQSLLLSVSIHATRIEKRSVIKKYATIEDAVVRTDETLQDLGKGSEHVSEVLFGLQDNWVDGKEIIEDKQQLLQQITTDLSLQPMGFVLQSEALYQHYISQQTHFSAILLSFANQNITVLVIIQGKLVFSETVGRSQDVSADVTEALSRYINQHQGTYLPAKIVCASFVHAEEELSDYQQQLLGVKWSDTIPFVQTPTIDVMRPELAISLISQQAGLALAVKLGTNSHQKSAHASSEKNLDTTDESVESPLITSSQENKKLKTTPDKQRQPNSDSQQTQDNADLEERAVLTKPNIEPTSNLTQASTFGVPIKSAVFNAAADDDQDPVQSYQAKEVIKEGVAGFDRLKKRKYNPKIFMIGGVIAGLIAVLGLGIFYTVYLSQVTAVIVPKNLTISKEVELNLDPNATTSDPENRVIPADKVTKSISKDVTIDTTGVKIVGDKAVGKVKIFNKTEADKTFPQGTVVSLGEIQFITNDEITVPAATIEESSSSKKTEYGEKSVEVTAYVIGVEGNIEKDKELVVGEFDRNTYSALSEQNFEGGSSREVRVVAEEDLATAIQKAKAEILTQANALFAKESGQGTYILATDQITVEEVSHSAELEVEADTLTTTVGATVTALSYQSADLQPIAAALLSSEVPEGYEIGSEEPQILSSPNDGSSGDQPVSLTANVTTKAKPIIDDQQLKEDIVGKPIKEAQSILQGRSYITQVSFVFYPTWSGQILGKIPGDTSRITIQKVEE